MDIEYLEINNIQNEMHRILVQQKCGNITNVRTTIPINYWVSRLLLEDCIFVTLLSYSNFCKKKM